MPRTPVLPCHRLRSSKTYPSRRGSERASSELDNPPPPLVWPSLDSEVHLSSNGLSTMPSALWLSCFLMGLVCFAPLDAIMLCIDYYDIQFGPVRQDSTAAAAVVICFLAVCTHRATPSSNSSLAPDHQTLSAAYCCCCARSLLLRADLPSRCQAVSNL